MARTNARWFVFLSVLAGTCCAVLESTAIHVALPAISQEFSISPARAIWVLGGSQIVIVALLMPLAALGDAWGNRIVYLFALAGFFVSTLACVLAQGFEVLIAARLAQAASVAGIMSVNFSLARSLFQDAELGKAIGILASTVAIASSAGPSLAGLVLTIGSWRWIFALMLPFAVLALTIGYVLLPRTSGSGRAFDKTGAAFTALMLASLVTSLFSITYGWPLPFTLALLAIACLAGAMIWYVSRGLAAPTFPFDLIRRPIFSLSLTASICTFSAQALSFVALPFLLFFHFQLTALEMALVLSVWPLTIAVIAPWIGRASDKLPAGPVGAAGLFLLALGLLLLLYAPADAGPVALGWRMMICGLGFGAFQTPNNRLIMLTAPKERSGAASGLLALARQFGRAIGTAIAALALSSENIADARIALLIAALAALVSAALSLARHRLQPD